MNEKRFSLNSNFFPNILWPTSPMCSTPACGILWGQKQSLAGAIPAGLGGILGIPLFHSGNNTKSRRGHPTPWDAIIKGEGQLLCTLSEGRGKDEKNA